MRFPHQRLAQLFTLLQNETLPQEELAQLQGKLSLQLKEGGFMGTMSGLLAQANVSRQNVVALLT